MSLNRGVTKSGVTKSGSECNIIIKLYIIVRNNLSMCLCMCVLQSVLKMVTFYLHKLNRINQSCFIFFGQVSVVTSMYWKNKLSVSESIGSVTGHVSCVNSSLVFFNRVIVSVFCTSL